MILAVWAVVLASALWGTTGTAATFLSSDVSPLATGSATMAIGGALLFAIAATEGFSRLCRRTIGGITGDTLGACQQIAEIMLLTGLALGI